MDGYAVRAIDTTYASAAEPVVLPVVGDVAAGAKSRGGMGPGLAMRIMTGAPIPAGADAVIPLEDTDRGVARVAIRRPVRNAECIRRAGEDLQAGQAALGAGAALGPQQIALLAAIGRDRVLVRPRPRVLVISTGSELVEVGQKPGVRRGFRRELLPDRGRRPDAGADAVRTASCGDDHSALLDVLESQLLRADLLITTGGVSMGAFDVVKQALSELGTVDFLRVAMQPGKPQGFGHLGDKVPIFCLPGNPVSALVSFEVFVRPAIRKLLGKRNLNRATVQAASLERIESPAGVRQYRRGVLHREADRRLQRLARRRARLTPDRVDGLVQLPRRDRRRGDRGRRRREVHGDPAAAVEPLIAGWRRIPAGPRSSRRGRVAAASAAARRAGVERGAAAQPELARAVGAVLAVPVGRTQRGRSRGRSCTRR